MSATYEDAEVPNSSTPRWVPKRPVAASARSIYQVLSNMKYTSNMNRITCVCGHREHLQ